MREFILTQRRKDAENAEKISGCLRHGVWGSAPASITSAHSAPLRLCVKTLSAALITFLSVTANALPLVWRADWPGSKPIETLVHRGTDVELEPQWYINGEQAASTNWTFQTFVQTNNQAAGEWFGPLPGAAFSHTNDIGAAFYNVMVRAQMPDGGVNYTAFARLRMLDSPGYTPGALPLPVASIDFSQVVAINAPWLLPSATNDIATIKIELGSISNSVSTLSAATATNTAAIAANSASISTNSAAIATNATAIAGVRSNLENNYYTASETDEAIDALAAYYITATAQGAAFATYAALTNATVYYSAGAARVPTRNDYCVVLADETHGGAEWRYIYAVADGATTGQWEAQYPIETNDYEALSNKPQINGVSLSGNKTGADLGLATPANVAAAALAATNYTDDAAALKNRFSDWVCDPAESDPGIPIKVLYGDPFNYGYDSWYFDTANGAPSGIYQSEVRDPNATYVQEYYYSATRTALPGYVLGSQTNKPLASADMVLSNSADIASLATNIASVAQAATNYTDAAISPTSPAFSNAVLSVGLGIDTNTVSVINELVDSAHDLPVTGAASVGALLLALAAAIAALKKNLRYSYNAATVSTGTTPTVTNVADRAINTAMLGSSVTAATVTLPAATTGRARDFFIDLTIEATTAPTLTFIDPATSTTINVAFGADSLADIDTGKNAVLFTEFPNHTWLVSVKHEEVTA